MIPGPRFSPEQMQQRLEVCRAEYAAAKARLADVGFICEGSLVERYTRCANPNCRCAQPDGRHGPYYQLSWKQAGKTVSRLLSVDDAALYEEWIANRRRLESALEDMKDLSRQAGEYLLAAEDRAFPRPAASPSAGRLSRPCEVLRQDETRGYQRHRLIARGFAHPKMTSRPEKAFVCRHSRLVAK